jgi:hypothetical protein
MTAMTQRRDNLGRLHCTDRDPDTNLTLPARISPGGTYSWFVNGELHRVDRDPVTNQVLPAVMTNCGIWQWRLNGKLHRTDKNPTTGFTLPAARWGMTLNRKPGGHWIVNGRYHRGDKDPATGLLLPAEVNARSFKWWDDNCRHRKDGPALRDVTGLCSYMWRGKRVTREYVVRRVTVISWMLWVGRHAPQKRRVPKAVLDEVVALAMPQMAVE